MQKLQLGMDEIAARPGHIPSLDGLRAISIAIVIFGHFLAPKVLFGFSAFGVVIFFFISGLLITRLFFAEIKKTGTNDLPVFYLRRFFRLYPAITVYMLIALTVAVIDNRPIPPKELSSVFFYFVNYLIDWRELYDIPTSLPIGAFWSLAVEEHFYIIMPFMFVFLKGRPQSLLKFALIVCAISLAIRIALLLIYPELIGTLATYHRSEMRFDAIAVGVLLAALAETVDGRALIGRLATPRIFYGSLVVLAISFVIRNDFFKDTIRFSIQSFALLPIFCNILFSSHTRWVKIMLNFGAVEWIGKMSYSIYIWHGGVEYLGGWLVESLPHALQSWSRVVLTLLAATASYYLVERPFLDVRRRIEGRIRQPRVVAQEPA
jgi:peptidoglycan/LPS O-acetylase OafA/YrhL